MFNLVPWRERRELERFRGDLDRLFDRFLDWRPFERVTGAGDWMPAVDLSETGKEINVNVEIPGVDPKDIDVSLSGRGIRISPPSVTPAAGARGMSCSSESRTLRSRSDDQIRPRSPKLHRTQTREPIARIRSSSSRQRRTPVPSSILAVLRFVRVQV